MFIKIVGKPEFKVADSGWNVPTILFSWRSSVEKSMKLDNRCFS